MKKILAALLTAGALALLPACEEFEPTPYNPEPFRPNPIPRSLKVELISPTEGARVSNTVEFKWVLKNLAAGDRITQEVRTDKGMGPCDSWYEDSFNAGTYVATTGSRMPYWDEELGEYVHQETSVTNTLKVRLSSNRYLRGHHVYWNLRYQNLSDTNQTRPYCTYPSKEFSIR